ncbi:MAG: hypothetical protein FWD79_01945 [Desulfobulbus sp.]|nr:hypothetical protein [Desulfobulbus sp.]
MVTIHTRIIPLFFLLGCFLPGLALAATSQTIHVEWEYTPPASPAVTGFKLYQEGVFVCRAEDPAATAMDCPVLLTQDTTNFTLTATFDDGTESPGSTPFPFTFSNNPDTQGLSEGPETTGSKQLTFSWQYDQQAIVKGFRVYQNSTLMCQTDDPTARQLTCTTDLVKTPAIYTLTAVNADNTETSFSNALTYAGDARSGTGDAELKAQIVARTVSGPAPLSVTFDGTASTGSVTSYQRDFGEARWRRPRQPAIPIRQRTHTQPP